MSKLFKDFTKVDKTFLISISCIIVFLWVLGIIKFIEIL